MTRRLRPVPLRSMKSWGRSNTSSQTKQELSLRTSCVSTSAPSMANPTVCYLICLTLWVLFHCMPLGPETINVISKRQCLVRSCSDEAQGCPSGMPGQPWLHHLHIFISFSCPLFPLFATLLLSFFCPSIISAKEPAPYYFFLIGPCVPTSVLKFGVFFWYHYLGNLSLLWYYWHGHAGIASPARLNT